jgi:transcriptional regulator with XRE-family HTH domain
MSQKEAAGQIGVDPGTLARWEQGEREPESGHLDNVTKFLAGNNTQRVRRAG